jgi:uncharacterized protein (DUF2336 family)
MTLTAMDIHQLMKNPTSVDRGALAVKVAGTYRTGTLSDSEAEIAADIFRLILKDAEKKIRETLAEQLFDVPNAPRDVIFKLACDETDIADRVLEHSLVLTDHDLIQIIQSTKEVLKLCAIARRKNVSEAVSDSLLDTRQVAVINHLFHNKGARLSAAGLGKSWDMVATHNSLLEALVLHGNLPLTIVERMYNVVSEETKRYIAREYKFSSPMVSKAAQDAREWELLGIVPFGAMLHPDDDDKVEDLVEHLYAGNRLSHSFLVRALCMGCLNLFEAGLARMAGVPRVNCRILIMGGSTGFRAIYKKAHMPEGFTDAVEKLLAIALDLSSFGYDKPDDFRRRVFDQVYIYGYQQSVDNMQYLLSIIGGKLSGAPASAATH